MIPRIVVPDKFGPGQDAIKVQYDPIPTPDDVKAYIVWLERETELARQALVVHGYEEPKT